MIQLERTKNHLEIAKALSGDFQTPRERLITYRKEIRWKLDSPLPSLADAQIVKESPTNAEVPDPRLIYPTAAKTVLKLKE